MIERDGELHHVISDLQVEIAEHRTENIRLERENTTLRADVARLSEAIEWACKADSFYTSSSTGDFIQKLRSRAFPPAEPEYDEVEVKRWECTYCGNITSKQSTDCLACNSATFELTGTRRIPKRKKVLRREELTPFSANGDNIKLVKPDSVYADLKHSRYFREWEEDAK
jgi:regulator of replication initiation timing